MGNRNVHPNAAVASTEPNAVIDQDDVGDFINQMPNEILMAILGYLQQDPSPTDFLNVSLVCRRWHQIVQDIHWRSLLYREYRVWTFHELAAEDRAPQAAHGDDGVVQTIYDPGGVMNPYHLYYLRKRRHVYAIRKSLTSNTPPRVLLFGPGIEQYPSNKLTPHLLCARNSTFRTVGLVRGKAEWGGTGAGFKIRYKDTHLLEVITLYTKTKGERENTDRSSGGNSNPLAKWQLPVGMDGEEEEGTDGPAQLLQPSIRELVGSMDAFIYVFNAHRMDDDRWTTAACQQSLHLIMDSAASACHALSEIERRVCPLLIFSCMDTLSKGPQRQPNGTRKAFDVDEIERLALDRLDAVKFPWSICKLDLETMGELEPGFDWLLYCLQRYVSLPS